ncbi:protein of unknown function [Ralstonia solanacearum CMR15]|nr:protein of unknown function [Ralstonia solanacearum CMR15]
MLDSIDGNASRLGDFTAAKICAFKGAPDPRVRRQRFLARVGQIRRASCHARPPTDE